MLRSPAPSFRPDGGEGARMRGDDSLGSPSDAAAAGRRRGHGAFQREEGGDAGDSYGQTVSRVVAAPDADFVRDLALSLRDELGLRLFNFDLIKVVGAAKDEWLVVDINYFPGIAKMPGYRRVLLHTGSHTTASAR